MPLTHADAGRRLGMAEREVTDVVTTPAGDVVRTYDGIWTLITDAGLVFNVPAPPEPKPPLVVLGNDEPEVVIPTRGRRKGSS